MSNDVARFEQLFITLHYIWILPIQGALITFMIWENVGIASLAGVFLISIQTIPLQGTYCHLSVLPSVLLQFKKLQKKEKLINVILF